MARKNVRDEERREILQIFKERVEIPAYIQRFAIKAMGKNADAYPTRKDGEFWCDDCGKAFTIEGVKLREGLSWKCPHCGATLSVHPQGRERYKCYVRSFVKPRVNRTDHYIKELTVYKGWQVIKEYFVSKHARIGELPHYDMTLLYSIWMNPKTRNTHIYSRYPIGMGQWYCRTPFSLLSKFHFVKSTTMSPLYNGWREDTLCHAVLPYFSACGCEPSKNEEIMFPAYIEAGTEIETLMKTGYRNAAVLLIEDPRYRKVAVSCWRGIVLALRHGYGKTIEELGWRLYLDYLKELKDLRLDWHSPHYLCPKDFHAAHAETSRRLTRKMRQRVERMERGRRRAAFEAEIRDRERLERAQTEFEKRIVKFLPLEITGQGLVIRPLKSVSEFADEGREMDHCVFSNRYYAKPESLILSARTDEGTRVETVEVSLYNFSIVQSRGYENHPTPRHDDIIRLVTDAMPTIKKLSKKPIKQSA